MGKSCPRCYTDCAEPAKICPSCGFAFSKFKRVLVKITNFASIVSLFIGLIIIVFNQSSQVVERLKPTNFTLLGVRSAKGTNNLITENFALGINSGTGIVLERLTFEGTDDACSKLKIEIIDNHQYKPSDVAIVIVKPTAIHLSYKPVPPEVIHMLLENGLNKEDVTDLFKIRPTSFDNQINKKVTWATIPGRLVINYFEPSRNSSNRLTKTYPVDLLLWGRKSQNLKNRLNSKPRYSNIDIDLVIQKYNKIMEAYPIKT